MYLLFFLLSQGFKGPIFVAELVCLTFSFSMLLTFIIEVLGLRLPCFLICRVHAHWPILKCPFPHLSCASAIQHQHGGSITDTALKTGSPPVTSNYIVEYINTAALSQLSCALTTSRSRGQTINTTSTNLPLPSSSSSSTSSTTNPTVSIYLPSSLLAHPLAIIIPFF
jgi:hypothetical protein